jgi:hypothetical protein
MSKSYELKKGIYYIGDPGLIIKKSIEGTKLSEKLYEIFYQNMNLFQEVKIDQHQFYLTRTYEGDGYYDGVGTDTGLIVIVLIEPLKNDERFSIRLTQSGVKFLDVKEKDIVTVENFNIYFQSGLKVITNNQE